MIDGVKVIDVTRYPDERGFFNEIVRFPDIDFWPKQPNHGMRVQGVANGWHIHKNLSEIFYIFTGVVRVVLKDCRTGRLVLTRFVYQDPYNDAAVNYGLSSTPYEYMEVVVGEHTPKAVLIPHGVAHGYKVLQGPCHMLYVADQTYEDSRMDEGRIDKDRWPEHDWGREIETR